MTGLGTEQVRSHGLNRREALAALGGLGGTIVGTMLAGVPARGEEAMSASAVPPAYRGDHAVKPLPFDPAKLDGLSERLLRSHHENNYAGAVKRLNQIQQQLGGLPQDAAPYQVG